MYFCGVISNLIVHVSPIFFLHCFTELFHKDCFTLIRINGSYSSQFMMSKEPRRTPCETVLSINADKLTLEAYPLQMLPSGEPVTSVIPKSHMKDIIDTF